MQTAQTIESAPPQERYLFKPFFGSSHWWTINILEKITIPKKTLDIGSGSGAMGQFLKSKSWTELDAVEIDPEGRKHVAHIYNEIVPTIQELSGKNYELVLLLDVLEHLTDPKKFLLELKPYLAPNARLLISVPNVAHWSMRLSLLLGIWNYTDRGLLDKTHYHFFTLKNLEKMFIEIPGTKINAFSGSISPAEFVIPERFHDSEFFKIFSKTRHWGAVNFPGFAAYQLLADISITS